MVFLNGEAIPWQGPLGEAIGDDSFLLCFNAHHEPMEFAIPGAAYGRSWRRVLDTANPALRPSTDTIGANATFIVADRSVVVLQRADVPKVR